MRPSSSLRLLLTRALPLIALSAAVAAGCAGPKLGDSPFLCNHGDPQCPEGYVCGSANRCVLQGTVLPDLGKGKLDGKLDGKRADLGDLDGAPPTDGPGKTDKPRPADTRPPDKPVTAPDKPITKPDQPPVAAKVVISELMINPKASGDTEGEWIELHNLGGTAVDLNGWTLKDAGADLHVIANGAPLMLPAGGYLVLGRSSTKTTNGGVTVQYVYKDFLLANTSDEVILTDKSGATIDSVTYSGSWTIPDGASLSLKNTAGDHNNPASWCAESSAWSGSAGDKGTPGAAPGC